MFKSRSDHRLHENIVESEFSEEIILDPVTPLEEFFSLPLYAGTIALIIGIPWWILAAMGRASPPPPAGLLWYGLLLCIVGGVLTTKVEVYYHLDLRNRTVSLYRRIFEWRALRHVCDFSGLECLALDTHTRVEKENNRRRVIHTYGLVLVLKTARKLQVTESSFEDGEALASRGRVLAERIGIPFCAGFGKLVVKKTKTGLLMSHSTPSRLGFGEKLSLACCWLPLGFFMLAGATKNAMEFYQGKPVKPPKVQYHGRSGGSSSSLPRRVKYGVDFTVTPKTLESGQKAVVVKNVGRKTAQHEIVVSFTLDRREVAQEVIKPPFAPSAIKTIPLPKPKPPQGKEMRVSVIVDPLDNEMNTKNNSSVVPDWR